MSNLPMPARVFRRLRGFTAATLIGASLLAGPVALEAAAAPVEHAIAVPAAPVRPMPETVSYAANGRATIYLSQSETRALGNWSVPAPPAALPWQLKVAYYSLAYGHVWIAQQYANRGWCSAFTVSIYPWETQGYYGYACTWR